MKRTSARLVAKQSQTNSSVTSFHLEGASDGSGSESPKRPTKRIKSERVSNDALKTASEPSAGKGKGKAVEVPKGSISTVTTSPRKKIKQIQQALSKPHPAPTRWQEQYDAIKHMRSRIAAPVDTMGCDRAQYKETVPKNQRFATLISLMLSSQTKDEVTDAAVSKLREAVGGSLSVDAIRNADDSTISEAIAKVGFWRRKSQYVKQAAQRLYDDFDSDVPKTVDELCSLPGVGPKMAFLALQVAWNLNVGIGVDVHVHRITNRLKWHKPPTKNPEETRLNLQSWLPIELHPEINHLLVGFGQTVCLPVGPRCDLCQLNSTENKLCPSAQKVVNAKDRKPIVFEEKPAGPKIEIAIEKDDP